MCCPGEHSNWLEEGEIDKQFKKYLSVGHIRYSKSPRDAPILLVKENECSWQMRINYLYLNKKITKNVYPLSRVFDLSFAWSSILYTQIYIARDYFS